MFKRALVLLAAGLLVAADKPSEDAVKEERGKLEGTWTMSSLEQGGKKSAVATGKERKLTIKGDHWTVSGGAKKGSSMIFTIDPSKDPKTIDLSVKMGAKEHVSKGIYKLEGDTLTICRCVGKEGDRPADFKSKKGYVLVVWKRADK
jgi:uncharacterized protein (TIGR03067 family)